MEGSGELYDEAADELERLNAEEVLYHQLQQAERERDQYRAGNTELLELLMKLHAGEHTAIMPRVRDILAGAGLLHADLALNWAALEARRPKQIPWAQAVNECVTDPEVRARLLAME